MALYRYTRENYDGKVIKSVSLEANSYFISEKTGNLVFCRIENTDSSKIVAKGFWSEVWEIKE